MIPMDAPAGAYPPKGRLCMFCGAALAKRQRRDRRPSTFCRQCYHAKRKQITYQTPPYGLAWWVRQFRPIPAKRPLPSPLRNYSCCGWLHPTAHDRTSEQHHQGINRYMRNRYRTSIGWQLRYLMGNTAEQAAAPAGLYEVAVTRRKMMLAAGLAGNWRVNDGQVSDDPSRIAGSVVRPDPQD